MFSFSPFIVCNIFECLNCPLIYFVILIIFILLSRRAVMTRSNPCAASRRAYDSPMPDEAPVISARRLGPDMSIPYWEKMTVE